MSDVFFNGKFVGIVENGAEFAKKLIEERRKGKLSKYLSVQYRKTLDTVYLALDGGRILRPLIVVKDGKPLLTEQHIKALQSGEASWSDLVKNGIIEFLDAAEEENAYVALSEEELTPKHTHLEINPVAIFGITTSLVPFANYIQSSKLNRGQKVQKQAMGGIKTDATVNLLHYPQVPIVQTFTQELIGREHAAGQNVVMAIINYDGYGMSDALLINAGSLQRGLGRSTYFRTYTTEKLRYPGGQIDEIGIPGKDVQGYTVEHDYRHLEQDGLARVGAEVFGGDVIIGKTSPPRFLGKLDVFSSAANIKKDTSERVRYGEKGIVNKVVITESEEGTPRIKVEVRETRIPEVGDKWSTKHGQKGILSRIVPEEDMPFTSTGIKPDIIFSPNGLPKRMTVSHMLEALAGKLGALAGRYVDGTPFLNEPVSDLIEGLLRLGFRDDGTEILYDGRTGERIPVRIFVGNIYYMRLKHQVADKIQTRARGPVTLLTRQPTEGKAKEGGLRLGEMEEEAILAHGASLLLKERFDSDREVVWVCERCGDLALFDYYKNSAYCLCGEKSKISPIEMAYAFKLFIDELKSLHLRPKIILEDKY